MKAQNISSESIALQNAKLTQSMFQEDRKSWLKSNKPYLSITSNVANIYTVKVFGKVVCTVNGEENAKLAESIIKNTLIVSGVILP